MTAAAPPPPPPPPPREINGDGASARAPDGGGGRIGVITRDKRRYAPTPPHRLKPATQTLKLEGDRA